MNNTINYSQILSACDNGKFMPLDPEHNCAITHHDYNNPNNMISIKGMRKIIHFITPMFVYFATDYICRPMNHNTFIGQLTYTAFIVVIPLLSGTEYFSSLHMFDFLYTITGSDEIKKLTVSLNTNLGIPQNYTKTPETQDKAPIYYVPNKNEVPCIGLNCDDAKDTN